MAYCLDVNDGEVLWYRNLPVDHGVRLPEWIFAGSPYVEAGLVVYNVGTHGLALYTADGTLAWKNGTSPPGYSTPVPFDFQGQRYLVLMGKTTFAAVQLQTGNVLWEQDWETTSSKVNAADAVVDSNLVFVSSSYSKGSALFDVAQGSARQLWPQLPQLAMTDMRTKMNSCVLWKGYLYGPNDKGRVLTCIERSTGKIKWNWKQSGVSFGNGSVTLADGKLIVLSEYGHLYIGQASPVAFQPTGTGRILTGRCWSVPVLANGKIYARNAAGKLVCVQLETTAPKVDAGSSAITWLKAGTTTVDLSGSVVDDTGDVTTIIWSPIWSPPGSTVDIADNSAPTTTAAFTQTGTYVLDLYAIDATNQEGSDRMEVRVYANNCEAARNNPAGDYAPPPYDLDNDCIGTFNDFAVFAADRWQIQNFNELAMFLTQWLADGSLTADLRYDAGDITLPHE